MSFPEYFSKWLANQAQRCLLAEVGVKTGGVEVMRYLSSIGYVSEPTDTPANTHYAARISGGFSFSRSLNVKSMTSLSYGYRTVGEIGGLAFAIGAQKPLSVANWSRHAASSRSRVAVQSPKATTPPMPIIHRRS